MKKYSTRELNKAFTLVELIIVIFLISLVYFLGFANLNTNTNPKKELNLQNLKTYLMDNFSYENSLEFICLDDDKYPCFVFVDGTINKDIKIENFFKEEPRVYKYNKDFEEYSYDEIKIDNITYKKIFELGFDSDFKHKDMIVDYDNKIYMFNTISNDIKIYDTTNDILDEKYKKRTEVRDAL